MVQINFARREVNLKIVYATFTTMGFGDWSPHPLSLFRFIVTAEAFIGIFTMALFVAAFTRKVIR